MVGLVLVSHSKQLAEGLLDMVRQVAGPEAAIAVAGGTDDGRLGTSAALILTAIDSVDTGDGVLVLVDLGSAVMTTDLVIDEMPLERRPRVRISGAPLVEGAIAAAVHASIGASLDEVAAAADTARLADKVL
ncbi:MAG: HPr family phosphocarrier protein [Chloroflexi bacterium]|nr:HPr family phosphocarrier protein [Chloroflexota bacterium]